MLSVKSGLLLHIGLKDWVYYIIMVVQINYTYYNQVIGRKSTVEYKSCMRIWTFFVALQFPWPCRYCKMRSTARRLSWLSVNLTWQCIKCYGSSATMKSVFQVVIRLTVLYDRRLVWHCETTLYAMLCWGETLRKLIDLEIDTKAGLNLLNYN